MSFDRTIVCLANSRKPPSGRCVAGREYASQKFGGWLRPVSARQTREVSLDERRYEDGRDPSVLDIVTIRFLRPEPENFQKENHVIDSDYCWTRSGSISWPALQAGVEEVRGLLWSNGDSSSYGENDRVSEQQAATFTRSLYLIRPEDLHVLVGREATGMRQTKRKIRACFRLNGHSYKVVVTDPVIEAKYFAGTDGDYPLPEALLCVSLGEVFHGYAYKLAAAVITPDRRGTTP